MSGRRWLKFWPQDWQRDPALRSCGLAARGLWMDLLCIMHEGAPAGHLTINGRGATTRQIGAIVGCGEREAVKLLQELEIAGVFSRTEEGVIYSRRMVRDAATSEAGREAIGKRWQNKPNPTEPPNTEPTRDPIRGADSLEAEAESKKETKATPSPVPPVLAVIPDQPQAPDIRTELWWVGLPIIVKLSGKSEAQARGIIGKLVKACRDDCASALRILREAESLKPLDPLAWIMKAAGPVSAKPSRYGFLAIARREAASIDHVAEPEIPLLRIANVH